MTSSDDKTEFRRALFGGLVHDLYSLQATNTDHTRFGLGRGARMRELLKDAAAVTADRLGVSRRPHTLDAVARSLVRLVETESQLEHVYELLDDAESRALYVELLRFRALGPRHVRLRRNTSAYWKAHRAVERDFLLRRGSMKSGRWELSLYEVPGRSGPIRLHAHHLNVLNTFALEQYAYGDAVRAEEGDVVVDGGACWGDTALAFADAVGDAGRVHSFEFVPENLDVLHENLRLNPALADRVVVHESALWHKPGETLAFSSRGPGTSITADKDWDTVAPTTTIDDLDDRVDFVKLDVEGAEPEALEGAARTIAGRNPKLAVAIYHSDDHFASVPARVKELHPPYRLFLEHLTVHAEETVLYATSGLRDGRPADFE